MGKQLSGTNKKNIFFFGGGTPWGVTPWGVTQVGGNLSANNYQVQTIFFKKVIEVFEIVIDEIE